jgi:hypothetical protein
MLWRGRRRRWAAVLALVAALAVPAAPVRAAGPETPGELVGVWEWLWQWAAEVVAPIIDPDAATSDFGRSSFIDPNG